MTSGFQRALVATVFTVAMLFGGSPLWAQNASTESEDFAVLIVGDETDAEMLRKEKILIDEFGKHIHAQGGDMKLLFYSYHFNKERERAYCESRLNVLGEDLLFVGVVTLKDRVPQKVVYRVDRIVNPGRAAKDVFQRALELVEGEAPEEPTAPQAPPTAPSPPTSPQPEPGAESDPSEETGASSASAPPREASAPPASTGLFRVQLGAFAQVRLAEELQSEARDKNVEVELVQITSATGTPVYKVVTKAAARSEADSMLKKLKDAGFSEAFLTRGE